MNRYIILILLCCFSASLFSQTTTPQYTLNGNATQDACNAYTLTQAVGNQSGSVWNNYKINLNQSFDFNFDVNLGSNDAGADGIVFVLQPISTSVGSTGGGLGYNGISPAVGVTIDTWQNTDNNDPTYDHIAIQLNGDLNHTSANNVAGPVQALLTNPNIEDGAWHAMRILWDVSTKTLQVYMDGNFRLTVTKDFVTDVFGGNPMVFWGFTGSTGGANNHQQFRTALNPAFDFGPSQKSCYDTPVTFNSTTISFTTIAKTYWDFGDASPIDSVNLNPIHSYPTPGLYTVKQRAVGADGCEATNTQVITVGSKPTAYFNYENTCVPMPPEPSVKFTDSSYAAFGTVNKWFWDYGNGQTSNSPVYSIDYTSPGDKAIKVVVTTKEGCQSDTLYKMVHMYTRPVIDFSVTDSVCLGTTMNFLGNIISSNDPVTNWLWNFGDSIRVTTQNASYLFNTPGNHFVIFAATSNGNNPSCMGLAFKSVFVVNKPTAYFKNNTICTATTATLTDSSYTSDGTSINQWWWNLGSNGLSAQKNPTVTYALTAPQTIKLVAYNNKGCASDTLTKVISINAKPIADFGYSTPVCVGLPVQFSDSSKVTGGTVNKWSWVYNGIAFSTMQNSTNTFAAGSQTVKFVATSDVGCVSDTLPKTFIVAPTPDVTINFKDACKNAIVNFTAVDNSATVTDWKWAFGDGATALTQNAQHIYTANGTYNVKLIATAANGCFSNALTKDIFIYGTNAFAGNDTIAAAGQPIQLNATGGLSYTWSPANLLSDPTIANPVTTLTASQLFTVKAFTPEGCESYDDVLVKIYKGPDIYLPNAFTPNGDGLNDVFKGTPVGIKQFNYLRIFNRWGQLLFSTTDYNYAWDGTWHGEKQPNGVYVVLANGVDFKGNNIDKRATVLLIR